MAERAAATENAGLEALIDHKMAFVERSDFFGALGVTADAPPHAVQSAYFGLAKQLHPDRLARAGLSPAEAQRARRVFEFATEAFRVLSDPHKREELLRAERSGQGNPFSAATSAVRLAAEESKILAHKGKKLLKMRAWADAETFLRRAAEKAPENHDVLTALGWAVFNHEAREEEPRAEEARKLWTQALELQARSPLTHYYLSLYHKARGETGKQRRCLSQALEQQPSMIEAQREMRLLEMRSGASRRGGRKSGGKSLLHAIFPSLAARAKKR